MPAPDPQCRVVVIGGGFSGAFFAAQLALHSNVPVHIAVIEPREALGGGVAYSTIDLAHRINVPAARMTVYAENPTDFDDWLRNSGELAADPEAIWHDGNAYPRRAAFGRYAAAIVASRQSARPAVCIEHVRDRATSVRQMPHGYAVQRADGAELPADIVILATSHPPPAPPRLIAEALRGDARLVANPWHASALDAIQPLDDIVIVGTGLSMADVVASLAQRQHKGKITAFSRRGLLPRGHAAAAKPFTWFAGNATPGRALALSQLTRRLVAEGAKDGVPWQAVFDDLRGNGRKIWGRLNETERRRFLRHLRVFWDSHRYRIAPQIEAVLKRKMQDGTLTVLAASLTAARPDPEKITLELHPRNTPPGTQQRLLAHQVIVTTGPAHGKIVEQTPVLRSLARQGLLQADRLGLGVQVDASGRALADTGSATATLFVTGPLAREQYGELMGMPQVSAQANAVAEQVAEMLPAILRAHRLQMDFWAAPVSSDLD